jgi:NADH dehydrogenase FAD-containing subunit
VHECVCLYAQWQRRQVIGAHLAATGRRMNPLMKLTANTVEEARDFFAATRASIVAANNITIIGGGSVGLELAGEIRAGAAAVDTHWQL